MVENKEEKIELTREYIIPLRREFMKVPRYRKAKKAILAIKQFIAKHMKVEDRDLNKVKINMYLNEQVWSRGIKNPLHKVKVKAVKKDGIVYVELAEIPEKIKFKIEKDKKRSSKITKTGVSHEEKHKHDEKDSQKEEIEKKIISEESTTRTKAEKVTNSAKHTKQSMPVRKVLKK